MVCLAALEIDKFQITNCKLSDDGLVVSVFGFMLCDFSHRTRADQRAEGDDEAADPHPDHQRANQHFERCLVAVNFAEAGENQIDVFTQAALMHGAADGRLLGRKEFQRGRDHAFVVAIVKHPKGAFDAEVGRLLRTFETLELDPVVADVKLLFDR